MTLHIFSASGKTPELNELEIILHNGILLLNRQRF